MSGASDEDEDATKVSKETKRGSTGWRPLLSPPPGISAHAFASGQRNRRRDWREEFRNWVRPQLRDCRSPDKRAASLKGGVPAPARRARAPPVCARPLTRRICAPTDDSLTFGRRWQTRTPVKHWWRMGSEPQQPGTFTSSLGSTSHQRQRRYRCGLASTHRHGAQRAREGERDAI